MIAAASRCRRTATFSSEFWNCDGLGGLGVSEMSQSVANGLGGREDFRALHNAESFANRKGMSKASISSRANLGYNGWISLEKRIELGRGALGTHIACNSAT